MTAPPADVLAAFDVHAPPRPLAGGMGRTWLAGDVVLKPVDQPLEHAWVCDVFEAWSSDEVAVPLPLRAPDGWSAHGWGAHVLLPGVTARAGDDPAWFRQVHEAFHRETAGLARPPFLDTRDDAWSYGDRVAWEGSEPEGSDQTLELLRRAVDLLAPVALPAQVVHGDLGGNVLRVGTRAGVIDWPPYWRPAAWALAVVATDAVCWEGARPSLLDQWSAGRTWPQLLLRAVIYRLATRGRNEVRGSAPVGSDGYVAQNSRILRLVEERL